MFKPFSKTKLHDAAMRHHGVGYTGIPEDVSKKSAVVIHCGVGYTGVSEK